MSTLDQMSQQKCECGSTEGPFERDIAGLTLCSPCAADSAVLCDICGDDAPVRVYAEGGEGVDLSIGTPGYIAVCRICDGATEGGEE